MKTETPFVGFDLLKKSVSISQILDRYGFLDRLHRSGENLSGPCPIHSGHNQTQFRVSLTRNCWICFGDCHGGGSIVDFVSRKEGLGIRDAALLIQDWFNVQPGNGKPIAPNGASRSREGECQPVANLPLHFTLGPLDADHPYLLERGLSKETIATFGVGHCTRGLLAGWIAIPIHNAAGRLVAYAGRWSGNPPGNTPKYRLPRGFRKSLELFNQHRITDTREPLVVVEGFFGCMKLWQAGCRRVISLMGSMLSDAQEDRIVELAGEDGCVLLLFDEDAAGRKGRAEARERLARRVQVRSIRLGGEGMQPDQLTPEQVRQLLDTQGG